MMITSPALWEAVASVASALRSFIFDYQSLIAGLLALAAAVIAARPVWRQLDRMSVETNSLVREFLSDRIRITERRHKWFSERLGSFANEVLMRICEIEERQDGIVNVHWAFEQDQIASKLLSDVQLYQKKRRDPLAIESCLEVVSVKLSALQDAFDKIHRTASMDQIGEDYAISDEEWAAMVVAGQEAEKTLFNLAGELSDAVKQLDGAFEQELTSLRNRLVKAEDQLLQTPP